MKRFVDEIVVHDARLAEDIARCLEEKNKPCLETEMFEFVTNYASHTGVVTHYEEPVTVIKVYAVESTEK